MGLLVRDLPDCHLLATSGSIGEGAAYGTLRFVHPTPSRLTFTFLPNGGGGEQWRLGNPLGYHVT